MLVSSNTEQRIVKLMEKGAKLRFLHYCADFDGYSTLQEVVLDYNGKRLNLTQIKTVMTTEGEITVASCPIAQQIIKRDDIRKGYCYNSDYGHDYREVYEHRALPSPRWVTEQWGFDEDGQRVG